MPKGVFKGTDEELKKLSEFVAKYNKNNKKLTTKFVVSFSIQLDEVCYNRVGFSE